MVRLPNGVHGWDWWAGKAAGGRRHVRAWVACVCWAGVKLFWQKTCVGGCALGLRSREGRRGRLSTCGAQPPSFGAASSRMNDVRQLAFVLQLRRFIISGTLLGQDPVGRWVPRALHAIALVGFILLSESPLSGTSGICEEGLRSALHAVAPRYFYSHDLR